MVKALAEAEWHEAVGAAVVGQMVDSGLVDSLLTAMTGKRVRTPKRRRGRPDGGRRTSGVFDAMVARAAAKQGLTDGH